MVGGNVLTSQRVVDVVLKAFGVAAASQGCMNNFTFGNEKFGYYRNRGRRGRGRSNLARPDRGPHPHDQHPYHRPGDPGTGATRCCSASSRSERVPVETANIGAGTAWSGRWNFLEPLNMAILAERRVFAPYGLEGGQPGLKGIQHFYM